MVGIRLRNDGIQTTSAWSIMNYAQRSDNEREKRKDGRRCAIEADVTRVMTLRSYKYQVPYLLEGLYEGMHKIH